MSWQKQECVRFGHCDPAGIVFYPRYFEMLNALIEDWFTHGLGVDYAQLLGPRRIGVPTVSLQSRFVRVSRMGDASHAEQRNRGDQRCKTATRHTRTHSPNAAPLQPGNSLGPTTVEID